VPGLTAAAWHHDDGDDVVLRLHVQPGAKRTEVAELLRFLASAFGVGQRAVLLLRGESSRQKTVLIARPVLRPDRDWT
jgi:uncharacterized protein YggU (UPF0235/DUF167 family)